ncbi:MAG: hypothetical protein OXH75_07345 [Acidobacteria bacterium]|nr:hypothetical protein [Acidobacteriota bacterium]
MVHEDEDAASGATDTSRFGASPGAGDAGGDPALNDGAPSAPDGERHVTRVVVWGTPAAVERGQRFAVRVGVACASRRTLADRRVEVRDHTGDRRATATLDPDPWPGTDALYHAEIALVAPDAKGYYTWEAAALTGPGATGTGAAGTGAAGAGATGAGATGAGATRETSAPTGAATATRGPTAPHTQASARFGVRVVSKPELVLTVVATRAESGSPLEGARVVAHPYRALTDERGVAEMRVPAGEYRLFVSGKGRVPFRFDGEVTADTTIRAVLAQDRELSDADIWS